MGARGSRVFVWRIVSIAILAGAILTGFAGAPAEAATKSAEKQAASEKKDPEAAKRSLDEGLKAYEAGKAAEAIKALSAALSAGGLTSADVAKALYYRGLAYRKDGKAALAVSDLSSAIWLKNGLSDADRAEAEKNRVAALGDTGVAPEATPAAEAPGQAEPAAEWQTATAARTAASDPAPAKSGADRQSATTPAAAPEKPAGDWQTAATTTAPEPAASTPPAAAATDDGAAKKSSSSTVASLFGNLFSGGSSSEASKAPVEQASATQASDALIPASTGSTPGGPEKLPWTSAKPDTATSSWSSATEIEAPAKAAEPKPGQHSAKGKKTATRVAAAGSPSANASIARKSEAGPYLLKIPSVRSEEEARALASRLKKEQKLEPTVEKKVYGAMGTFYSVAVGPFTSAEAPREACQTLKAEGVDCLVTR